MMRSRRGARGYCVILSACVAAAGCDSTPSDVVDQTPAAASAFTVRDSAGVTIAESRDSAWTPATAWTVDSVPVLQIGSRDGAGVGSAFGSVGPVLRFRDGRIAVGDQQALEVRVFSAEGEFLGAWGGRGDGPGETRRLDALALLDEDDLVLTNNGLYRHEVFRSDGTHLRSLRAPAAEFFESRSMSTLVVGWLGDGRFVVGPTVSYRDLPPGRQRVEGEWHVIGGDGGRQGLLARLPDRTVDVEGDAGPPGVVFYGARASVATDRSGLWYGWPEQWEFRHLDPNGLQRLIRLDRGREAVPEPLVDHLREWYEAGPSRRDPGQPVNVDLVLSGRAAVERSRSGGSVRPPEVSDSLPAFGRVIVSRDGHLWIQEHASAAELLAGRPDRVAALRWTVLDPDGRWLGTVRTPEALRIEEIGSDYILGVWLDESEVPYVRMHRITKPGG